MRPEKRTVPLTNTAIPIDPEPLNMLDDQPPPPPAPAVAESNPTPQRAATSQRPISLVVRSAKKSRSKTPYASISRSNYYLLARSLVENDQPPKSLAPEQKPQATHKTALSRFHREARLPPDFTISDFIWQFSEPDSQVDNVFAALKSYDPQTFSELVAGFD